MQLILCVYFVSYIFGLISSSSFIDCLHRHLCHLQIGTVFISSCTNKLPFFLFVLLRWLGLPSTVLSKVIRADGFALFLFLVRKQSFCKYSGSYKCFCEFSLSSWRRYLLYLGFWNFLMRNGVDFCQILFLHQLIWLCDFSCLVWWCDVWILN